MRIALAQTRFPQSLSHGVSMVTQAITDASRQDCEIICFPESILPGLRGVGYPVEAYDHESMSAALEKISSHARESGIAVILPMEWRDEQGDHIVAFVISDMGEVLGYQTKNQYDPDEDQLGYSPGTHRRTFAIGGVTFGIVICHEGWRYPETVRWAAREGASIVFHPQFTNVTTHPEFYQGAMVCRSQENNIYFASVNFALPSQAVTTTLVSPLGERLAVAHAGREELLVQDIDPEQASRRLAERFAPNRF